jgi:uncharacterized protein YjbI with pentapeptide repeats
MYLDSDEMVDESSQAIGKVYLSIKDSDVEADDSQVKSSQVGGKAYLIVESDKEAEVGDLNEDDFDFKAIDFDKVDFDDSSNDESDFEGLDLDQIDLDGFYNVESNSESESVPRVETDLDADFGLMDEIDFATASLLTNAFEALERGGIEERDLRAQIHRVMGAVASDSGGA